MAQTAELLTDRQRQTLAARRARASRFATPEEKSDHFREMGRIGNERRITLSGDEATALVEAYALLGRIAERARLKVGGSPTEA